MEIKSSKIVEAVDTNVFVPLLSKKASDIVIALPETLDSSTSITYLQAHHDAGLFTYTQGGQRKFIIPGNEESNTILGGFDFGFLKIAILFRMILTDILLLMSRATEYM